MKKVRAERGTKKEKSNKLVINYRKVKLRILCGDGK